MEIVKFEQNLSTEIKAALSKFQEIEPTIETAVEFIKGLPKEITDEEQYELARKAASKAGKVLKSYSAARLEMTRPIDEFKKGVMSYEKEKSSDLEAAISSLKSSMLKYSQEQERIKQEELARIEAERLAREKAERAKQERESKIRYSISSFESQNMSIISGSNLESLKTYVVPEVTEAEYFEFLPAAKEARERLESERKTRLDFLISQEKLEAERKKAEAENAKEAAKLAEIQAKQAAERAAIEAEQRRIESENRKAAEENARIEAEIKRKLAEKAEREAEEARIAELTKKRLKGLTQGIESWEIIELTRVPIHLLRIELNLPEVKRYLKENESVPGMEIQFKNNLVLNAV